MTVMCQRCGEYVDGVPDGCRDPSCPRTEIEDALEEQADEMLEDTIVEIERLRGNNAVAKEVAQIWRNLKPIERYNLPQRLTKALLALMEHYA